ncbi:TPA: DNA-binding protein [Pseudomonas aeruginosa]
MSEHEGNDQVADVRARVFREADRLYEELGRERFPQVEAVRRAARADMNTVTRVMKEWRHLQTAKPEPVHLELPPELHREALTLGSALWSAATEMANASLRKAEAKGRAEAQLEGIAARAEDLQQRLDAAQKEVFRLQAADELAQEQRKRAAAEANTQAQRFTKVQAERDEARKQAQDAGLRAARFEGELESLRESNAQLLAHVGAATAKSPASPAKGRSKSNKPEGQ